MKQTTSFSKWVKVPLSMQVLMVVLTACVTLFFSCQKDILLPTQLSKTGETREVRTSNITIDEAKTWFESKYGKSTIIKHEISSASASSADSLQDGLYFWDDPLSIVPLWSQTKISIYLNTYPIALVPLRPIPSLEGKGLGYSLVFYRDSLQQITARLQVYKAAESYTSTHTTLNVQDFSGLFYQIGLDARVHRLFFVENGHFTRQIFLAPNRANTANSRSCDCFHANSGEWIGRELWCLVLCAIHTDSGFPLYVNPNVGADGSWLGLGATTYNNNPPTGSGGISGSGGSGGNGGAGVVSSEIDNSLFDVGAETTVRARYQDIYMSPPMNFSDTEFEEFYFNRRLFTQVEHFLTDKGRTPENIQIIRIHKDLVTQNIAYEQANSETQWKTDNIEALKKYTSNGFTNTEFVKLFANQTAFKVADAFLNRNSFDTNSKLSVKKLANSGNQMGDYTRFLAITQSHSLTEPELATAVLALKNHVEKSKYNLAVYNYFTEHNVKFNFKTNSSQSAPAAFNYADMSITFTSLATIEEGTFAEELFHGYQNDFYQGGLAAIVANANVGRANIEFEAKLFYDFINAGSHGCCIALQNNPGASEYLDYVLLKSHDSENIPSEYSTISDKYFYFMQKFVIEKPNYNYIDNNKLPKALFNISVLAR